MVKIPDALLNAEFGWDLSLPMLASERPIEKVMLGNVDFTPISP
jgi:hypothetical protein